MKKVVFCCFLFLLYFSKILPAQKNVQGRIDSLELFLKTAPKDTSRIHTLLRLCESYQNSDPGKCSIYLKEAAELANELGSRKWIAESTYSTGLFEYNKGNFDKAKKNYVEALRLFELEKDELRMAQMVYNIGILEVYTGNYAKANERFFGALRIYEKLGKKDQMSNAFSAIGNVYGRQGNNKMELEFHKKSLKIREDLNDSYGISASYINIGNAYGRKQLWDTALIYYFKGLKLAEEIRNQKWILNALGNIGSVYAEQKKYDEALKYMSKGLLIAENIGDKKGLCTYNNTIGQIYAAQKKLPTAQGYYERAMQIAEQTGNKEEMKQAYRNLADLAQQQGDYRKAYDYHNSYSNVKDSILNEANSAQINEMQAKYDSEKQEQEIALLNKDNEIQLASNRQQKIIIWAIGAGLLLVLILASFIFRQFREKQKANIALQSAYAEIEEKNKNITDSINYAKRIQTAILPSTESIRKHLPGSFILYKPKDIVSGDFYWFAEKNDQLIVAIADCTGHGVPGAFMSMVGNDILTQIVIEKGITVPNLILTQLHEGVKNSLKQNTISSDTKDGMDIAVVTFDKNDLGKVAYSGAMRPLWLIKKGGHEVQEVRADKHSIGGAYTEEKREFTNHNLQLDKGDIFYLSTDGYADQFGGEQGKKMMTKNLKELLVNIRSKEIEQQKQALEDHFNSWKLQREQVDDVLVFGIRI